MTLQNISEIRRELVKERSDLRKRLMLYGTSTIKDRLFTIAVQLKQLDRLEMESQRGINV